MSLAVLYGLLLVLDGLVSGLVVMLGLVIATGILVRREMRCISFGKP